MMKRAAITGILLTLVCAASAGAPSVPVVLLGTILDVGAKDEEDMELEKSIYIHGNTQFLVVDVERVLVGEWNGNRVLVGMDIDRTDIHGVLFLNPSYGILDPEVWRVGSQVLIIYRPPKGGKPTCFPNSRIDLPPGAEVNSSDPLASAVYIDERLRKYQGLPVLCVSGGEVFLLK